MTTAARNYYDILNANPTSTIDELKLNYKQLILQYHPDKMNHYKPSDELSHVLDSSSSSTSSSSVANERHNIKEFIDITEAWNCLKDPVKRKQYDAQLMLNKFHKHNNTYAKIMLNDMKKKKIYPQTGNIEMNELLLLDNDDDDDGGCCYCYVYDCRCGGQYIIDDDSAEQFCCKRNNANDVDDAAQHNTIQNNKNLYKNDNDDEVGNNAAGNDDYIDELIVECNECSLVIILNG
uniref:J domain-containing protein n=1 Tax=Glossina brevipalpis TaxID=37001 RepID=A0A1A9WRZ0_9MUSC